MKLMRQGSEEGEGEVGQVSTWASRGSPWGPGHEMGCGWQPGHVEKQRMSWEGSPHPLEGVGADCQVLKAPGCLGMRLDIFTCF